MILVGSNQDKIVPFQSARIEGRDPITAQMAECILERLENSQFVRVDVSYGKEGKKFDKIIGKAAHMKALECKELHTLLILRYASAF